MPHPSSPLKGQRTTPSQTTPQSDALLLFQDLRNRCPRTPTLRVHPTPFVKEPIRCLLSSSELLHLDHHYRPSYQPSSRLIAQGCPKMCRRWGWRDLPSTLALHPRHSLTATFFTHNYLRRGPANHLLAYSHRTAMKGAKPITRPSISQLRILQTRSEMHCERAQALLQNW